METVTISLETYNNMNKELKLLREQVKEKEIIIHEPFNYTHAVNIIFVVFLIFAWIFLMYEFATL